MSNNHIHLRLYCTAFVPVSAFRSTYTGQTYFIQSFPFKQPHPPCLSIYYSLYIFRSRIADLLWVHTQTTPNVSASCTFPPVDTWWHRSRTHIYTLHSRMTHIRWLFLCFRFILTFKLYAENVLYIQKSKTVTHIYRSENTRGTKSELNSHSHDY